MTVVPLRTFLHWPLARWGLLFAIILVGFNISVCLAVGPEILPTELACVRVTSWVLEEPTTVFGVDNFGARKGEFVLHVTRDGQEANLPINIEYLDGFETHTGMFDRWDAEKALKDATCDHQGALWITYDRAEKKWLDDHPDKILLRSFFSVKDILPMKKEIPLPFRDNEQWDFLARYANEKPVYDRVYVDPQTWPILQMFFTLISPLVLFSLVLRFNRMFVR